MAAQPATLQTSQVTMQEMDTHPTTAAPPSSAFFQFQAAPATLPNVPRFSGDHYRKPQAPPIGGPLTAPPTTLQFQLATTTTQTESPSPAQRLQPQIHSQDARPPIVGPSTSTSTVVTSTNETTSTTSTPQRRQSKAHRSHGVPPAPLTSDARAEHLLLAARKIGKDRAAVAAGIARDSAWERSGQDGLALTEGEAQQQRKVMHTGGPKLSPYYRDAGQRQAGGSMNPQTPTTRHRHQYFGESTSRSSIDGLSSRSPLGGTTRSMQHMKGSNPASSLTGSPLKIYSTTGAHNQATGAQRQEAIAATVQHGQAVPGGSGKGQTTTPPTPLSSLLDAARMMNHGKEGSVGSVDQASAIGDGQSSPPTGGARHETKKGGEGAMESHLDGAAVGANGRRKGRARRESTANGSSTTTAATTSGRRTASAIEQPASPPAPKRKRVSTARALASMEMDQDEGSAGAVGMGRVRSALDVLADQAAAAVTQDGRGKGKGKARELEAPSEEDKDKGRVRTRTAGRGRGRPRIHQSQGQVRTKKRKEEERLKPKPGMKTPRPPPRVRGVAPLPASDNGDSGATNASTSARASAASWQTGTVVATPARMISPTGTSAERQRSAEDVFAGLKDDIASVSALGIFQQSQQEILHGDQSNGTPHGHPPEYSLEQMGEAAALDLGQKAGIRPVTRWTAEEGSFPVGPLEAGGVFGAPLPPNVEETTLSSPITLTCQSEPSPIIQDRSAPLAVEVDDGEEVQNISNLVPAPAEEHPADINDFNLALGEVVGDKITQGLADEGFRQTGTDGAGILLTITEGDMRQSSAPLEDVSSGLSHGQADVELQREELPTLTETYGAEELLTGDIPDLAEMKAPDPLDRDDDEDEAGPDSGAGTKQEAGFLQQEKEVLDAGADTSKRAIINELPESSSNGSISPPVPPPALLGINSSQPLEATSACAFNNADDSDADAEGEVDVDAEGEIDSEIEGLTIISPSLVRSETGIQILGHRTEIAFRDTRRRSRSETVASPPPVPYDTGLDNGL